MMQPHACRLPGVPDERKLALVASRTDNIVIITDSHGLIEWVNDGFTRTAGYTLDEVIGKNPGSILQGPDTDPATIKTIHDHLQRAEGFKTEILNYAKDGHKYWLALEIQPIHNDEGVLTNFIAIESDITARKQMEEALRQSEEQNRLIVDTALDAVVIIDSASTIIGWNAQAETTFGYSREEALGKSMGSLIIPERFRIAHERGMKHFLTTGHGPVLKKRIEIIALHRDGREFPTELAIIPMRTGDSYTFSAFLRDITDRKRTELELRQAKEDAETANRAKTVFLASMSHEIRTPLNGVSGMIGLLMNTELTERQQRYVQIAKSSATSLLTLINDILDFSKIEAGKFELETVDFDVRLLIEEIAEAFSHRAAEKHIELGCHVQLDIPPQRKGDPSRLRQILMNLISNAFKFTDRGHIIIRVAHDPLNPAALRFSVTDTGIGIPPDRLDRLFKSFSQVDSSTTRKYGGTGLGLAISKHLAELMGGTMGVESLHHAGSTFWFTASLPPTNTNAKPFLLPASVQNVRVLAVDDNAAARDILHEQLLGWQFEVETASSAQHALDLLTKAADEGRPFTLAIVDRHMPYTDGLQLAESIHKHPLLNRTIQLMATSIEDDINKKELAAIGVVGHLIKPLRTSQLYNAINTALANHRPLPAVPAPNGRSTAQRLEPARHTGARILLAEDNEINQIVAADFLQNAGYQFDIVPNGKLAVQAVYDKPYDLVLMDCQMPEMDGFEAAQRIRARETTGQPTKRNVPHLPIIALTANVLKGDRELCLAAGMDAYLSKPLDPRALISTIESTLSATYDTRPTVLPPAPPADSLPETAGPAPLNLEMLLKRYGTKTALLEKLLNTFQQQALNALRELQAGLDKQDPAHVARISHTLKGAAGYVSADRIASLTLQLETLGRDGQLAHADNLVAQLQTEVDRCTRQIPDILTQFKTSAPPPSVPTAVSI